MNPNPTEPTTEQKLRNIVTTVFHSYDARGNHLAINDAVTKLQDLLLQERIAGLKRSLIHIHSEDDPEICITDINTEIATLKALQKGNKVASGKMDVI